MKKIFFIFLIFNSQFLTVNSQSQFQRTIGGTNHDYANCIIQTTDGGYAVAGYTFSFSSGFEDMYIMKLNSSGSLQWARSVGGAGNDIANSVIQTTDGGFAISGHTYPFGSIYPDICILKLDSSGSLLWSRTISRANYDIATSIIQTAEGGFVITGFTATGGVFTDEIYIVKLNAGGTYLWSKTYGGSGDEIAYSIIQTSDGGFAAAGYSNSYGPFNVFNILKTDSIGILQWSRLIGETGTGSVAYSIIQTSDGGFALAGGFTPTGTGNYDMYIVKLSSSGSIQWTRTLGGTGDDNANSIIQTTDAGFVVAGYTNSFGAGNYDMYIVKLNSGGTLQWSRTVGGTGDDQTQSIIKTTDGGFAVAGYTTSFGAGANDFYIVKFDAGGNTCGNSTSPSSLTGISGTLSSPTPTVMTQNPTVTTPAYTTGTGGTLTTICSLLPPLAPNLVSPPNGALYVPSTVRFIWNKSFSAVTYRLQVALDSLFINLVVNDSTLTDSTIVVTNLPVNSYYWWRVNAKNAVGTSPYSAVWRFGTFFVGLNQIGTEIPKEYNLYNNYPNPFNPSTNIRFDIPNAETTRRVVFTQLIVYDLLGREVTTLVNKQLEPGTYEVEFYGTNYSSGVYFYKLETEYYTHTKRMVLVK